MTAQALVTSDRQITLLLAARQSLQRATSARDLKKIGDAARAAEVYARRQKLSEETIGLAHALKIEALDKLGALTSKMEKAGGGRPTKTGTKRAPVSVPTLKELGIDKKTSSVAQRLHRLGAPTVHRIAQRQTTLAQELRQQRHVEARQQARTLTKPDGLFDVIVIDPPWQYDRQPTDSGMRGEVDYATMPIAELQALTLPAAPTCVLWLWTTNSFMREAYDLAAVWGFEVKTILTWDKGQMGLGSWLRNVTEHCLLAVRGRPTVTLTNQTTLLREPRREHSRKPEAFYALVEALCPGRKYEHFSRTPRPGWDGYGVEAIRFRA